MKQKVLLQQKFINAIKKCNYEMVVELYNHGADPFLSDGHNELPIKIALYRSNESIVYYLFQKGVHKKYGFEQNKEFLLLASKHGYSSVIDILLKDNVFTKEILDKALLNAAESGNLLTLDSLLNNGADINCEDYLGDTPLFLAIEKGHFTAMLYLLRGGAKIFHLNKSKENALLIATNLSQNSDIVRYLISQGIDVNQQDIYGNTPLLNTFCSIELNFENDFDDILYSLINAKADIHQVDNCNHTALIYACMFSTYYENTDADSELFFWIKNLLERGIDPNIRDDSGKTALDYALENQFHSAITLLEKYTQIKRPNLNVKESNSGKASLENFADDSFLSRNGYTTKLKSEERWRILKERIMPNYSTQNIVSFMGTMTRRYKSQKNGEKKYGATIKAYELDIDRLIKYSTEFTIK